jgi:hypothetical protein
MKEDIEYSDFKVDDIYSIINFMKENYIQLFLLLLVPIIIYVVDHISNINAVLFGLPSPIPGVSTQSQPKNMQTQDKLLKKRKGSKK